MYIQQIHVCVCVCICIYYNYICVCVRVCLCVCERVRETREGGVREIEKERVADINSKADR